MSDVNDQALTVWKSQLPALKPAQKQLVKQLNRMQYIATVARAAMDELSNNYMYNEFKVHMSLAVTAQLRKDIAAGHISPEEEAAYQHATVEFLRRMLEVSQVASCQILDEQDRVSKAMRDGDFIDDLVSFFLGS